MLEGFGATRGGSRGRGRFAWPRYIVQHVRGLALAVQGRFPGGRAGVARPAQPCITAARECPIQRVPECLVAQCGHTTRTHLAPLLCWAMPRLAQPSPGLDMSATTSIAPCSRSASAQAFGIGAARHGPETSPGCRGGDDSSSAEVRRRLRREHRRDTLRPILMRRAARWNAQVRGRGNIVRAVLAVLTLCLCRRCGWCCTELPRPCAAGAPMGRALLRAGRSGRAHGRL